MQVSVEFGRERLVLAVPDDRLVAVHRRPPAPPIADVSEALANALENPLDFPALRLALTPDDHVAIVVDEHLPRLPELLTALLEYLGRNRIAPEAITLVCAPASSRQAWLDRLPEAFEDTRVEVHDPDDRRALSYLATTRRGHRVYLNRTVVDADQAVVLTAAGYRAGAGTGVLYPALGDAAIRQEALERLARAASGGTTSTMEQEAAEVCWLLGAPFFIQVVEGAGDDVGALVAGLADTNTEAQRLRDAEWRCQVERAADLVVAGMGGDPARHGFDELAQAAATAAAVVYPGGHIVLLTRAAPELGPGADMLRQAESAEDGLELLRQHQPPDLLAALQWANAAAQAKVYLLGGLAEDTVDELFAVRLDRPEQVQRLVDASASVLVLNDAHKVRAVLEE